LASAERPSSANPSHCTQVAGQLRRVCASGRDSLSDYYSRLELLLLHFLLPFGAGRMAVQDCNPGVHSHGAAAMVAPMIVWL
jgi:hypothetical protein